VRTVVNNPLPYPRSVRSPEFAQLVDRLRDIITGSYMPDVAAPVHAGEALACEPIPDATVGEITGLLEHLALGSGREDVFRIAIETNREFGRVIAVVNAAELLELVDTPKRIAELASAGVRFLKATPAERPVIWRGQLLQLRVFREFQAMLERAPAHRIDRDVALEHIALQMPSENSERVFETLVDWGRFGNLLSYDENEQMLVSPSQED
jgi:NitT/TauT family transport system ATP-binding protein